MRKIFTLVFISLAVAATAAAQNVGHCGWGSKLFDGQKGIAPQVLAVTTNGTSGNQTFAITSGTSGCTQNGVVRSAWKTAAFIDQNMNRLAKDVSRGEGESLMALASLLGVDQDNQVEFNQELQGNFAEIFASANVNSVHVYEAIKTTLAKNDNLSAYAAVM